MPNTKCDNKFAIWWLLGVKSWVLSPTRWGTSTIMKPKSVQKLLINKSAGTRVIPLSFNKRERKQRQQSALCARQGRQGDPWQCTCCRSVGELFSATSWIQEHIHLVCFYWNERLDTILYFKFFIDCLSYPVSDKFFKERLEGSILFDLFLAVKILFLRPTWILPSLWLFRTETPFYLLLVCTFP